MNRWIWQEIEYFAFKYVLGQLDPYFIKKILVLYFSNSRLSIFSNFNYLFYSLFDLGVILKDLGKIQALV